MQQRKKVIWYTTAAIVVVAAVTIFIVRAVNAAALAREIQSQHGIDIGYNNLTIRQTTFNEKTLQCLPKDLSHIAWFFVDTVTIQNEQAFSELIRRLSNCQYGQIVNSAHDSEFIFTQFGLMRLETIAIYDEKLSAAQLAHLSSITTLDWLNIIRCKVKPGDLREIGAHTSLKTLRLADNGLPFCDVAKAAVHWRITDFGFHDKSQVDEEAMACLLKSKSITNLGLSYCDLQFQNPTTWTSLKKVSLSSCRGSHSTFRSFLPPQLEELSITHSDITEDGTSLSVPLPARIEYYGNAMRFEQFIKHTDTSRLRYLATDRDNASIKESLHIEGLFVNVR
jgi:hypothetical protein